MKSFSYEGGCFVLNISSYSYWFVEENEKLKFLIITLYLFHRKKAKLSKTTQSSHFLSSSEMVMKYRTNPWRWNLVSVRDKTVTASKSCLSRCYRQHPFAWWCNSIVYTCACQSDSHFLSRHGLLTTKLLLAFQSHHHLVKTLASVWRSRYKDNLAPAHVPTWL